MYSSISLPSNKLCQQLGFKKYTHGRFCILRRYSSDVFVNPEYQSFCNILNHAIFDAHSGKVLSVLPQYKHAKNVSNATIEQGLCTCEVCPDGQQVRVLYDGTKWVFFTNTSALNDSNPYSKFIPKLVMEYFDGKEMETSHVYRLIVQHPDISGDGIVFNKARVFLQSTTNTSAAPGTDADISSMKTDNMSIIFKDVEDVQRYSSDNKCTILLDCGYNEYAKYVPIIEHNI